ncbi:MAG: hypothetical protein [Bacteriophage sp.]|nr:MAG: hypothetical protein [Bacteriophage sp.]
MNLTKLEKKTTEEAIKHGYTFSNDSHFTCFQQGNRTIRKLIAKGFLVKVDEGNGVEYRPTQDALDFMKYGV